MLRLLHIRDGGRFRLQQAWGWRVPVLLSIIVVGVGLFIRLRSLETPEFTERVKETGSEARVPVIIVLRDSPKDVLVTMGANVAFNDYSYVLQVFVLSYVTSQLDTSESTALTGVLIAAAIGIFTVPAFGAFSALFASLSDGSWTPRSQF